MTYQEVEEKADSLTKELGFSVKPIFLKDLSDESKSVVGYFKMPNRLAKMRILSKIVSGEFVETAAVMLPELILKEHSDPRLYSELPENDGYFIGAAMVLNKTLEVAIDLSEKKK